MLNTKPFDSSKDESFIRGIANKMIESTRRHGGLTPSDARRWSDSGPPLVNVCLVSWAVLNASTLQFGFYILRDPTLDPHGIHAAHVPSCLAVRIPAHGTYGFASGDSHVRCQRPTQLVSGSINAIIPSKYVDVHD